MSGHSSSRRRAYGKRQKDIRDRRGSDLSVDLDGPVQWPRGGGWEPSSGTRSRQSDPDGMRPGGPA